jgi:hypothetical protein
MTITVPRQLPPEEDTMAAQPNEESDAEGPLNICLDFLRADPRDEDFRLAYCAECRQGEALGLTRAQRLATCRVNRCGLRDPQLFREEQAWLNEALSSLQWAPGTVPVGVDLDDINHHIAAAGAATPALLQSRGGRPQLGLYASTFLGTIHRALLTLLLDLAGDIRGNIDELNANAFRAYVGKARRDRARSWRAYQRAWAAQLRDAGFSDNAIATHLHCSPKAIRDWLGPRERWRRPKEGGS